MRKMELHIIKNNSNLYSLSKGDYIDLYPLLTPEEIFNEFPGRTKSVRTIQRIYKNIGFPSVRQGRLNYVNTSYAVQDLDIDEDSWIEHVASDFENMREKIIKKIWDRINRVERLQQEMREDYGSYAC